MFTRVPIYKHDEVKVEIDGCNYWYDVVACNTLHGSGIRKLTLKQKSSNINLSMKEAMPKEINFTLLPTPFE